MVAGDEKLLNFVSIGGLAAGKHCVPDVGMHLHRLDLAVVGHVAAMDDGIYVDSAEVFKSGAKERVRPPTSRRLA